MSKGVIFSVSTVFLGRYRVEGTGVAEGFWWKFDLGVPRISTNKIRQPAPLGGLFIDYSVLIYIVGNLVRF